MEYQVRMYAMSDGDPKGEPKELDPDQVEGMAEGFIPPARKDSAGSLESIERGVLIGEVRRHLALFAAGQDRERNSNVFWLYYRVGLSASAIAALPGIDLTTKGVESLILRMTREVRERMLAPKPVPRRSKRNAGEGILSAHSF